MVLSPRMVDAPAGKVFKSGKSMDQPINPIFFSRHHFIQRAGNVWNNWKRGDCLIQVQCTVYLETPAAGFLNIGEHKLRCWTLGILVAVPQLDQFSGAQISRGLFLTRWTILYSSVWLCMVDILPIDIFSSWGWYTNNQRCAVTRGQCWPMCWPCDGPMGTCCFYWYWPVGPPVSYVAKYPLVNKQLDPENSQLWMVSLVFQPRWLPGSTS